MQWSDLGLAGPQPMTFKMSASRGTNLPSQLEDNVNQTNISYSAIYFYPDNEQGGAAGTNVTYKHYIANCALENDIFNFDNTVLIFKSDSEFLRDNNERAD